MIRTFSLVIFLGRNHILIGRIRLCIRTLEARHDFYVTAIGVSRASLEPPDAIVMYTVGLHFRSLCSTSIGVPFPSDQEVNKLRYLMLFKVITVLKYLDAIATNYITVDPSNSPGLFNDHDEQTILIVYI
jgi:hypothetical protein